MTTQTLKQHHLILLWQEIRQILVGDYSPLERLRKLMRLFNRYYQLSKQRQALGNLTDDQLKDIGISRVDALQEASKPFWKE